MKTEIWALLVTLVQFPGAQPVYFHVHMNSYENCRAAANVVMRDALPEQHVTAECEKEFYTYK